MESEAKKRLMERLDKNLLNHAKELISRDGLRIDDVYTLKEMAEVHCYLKTDHAFDAAEVEALLYFADPLEAAYDCWEISHTITHPDTLRICELLEETRARECFAPAEPEPPKKLSVREQLQTAMQEVRQPSVPKERPRGGEVR